MNEESEPKKSSDDRSVLLQIARTAMNERDFISDFSQTIETELHEIATRKKHYETSKRDMRHLLWCSIDNDDSEDLDQLTFAETLDNGDFNIFVAVSDVDDFVSKGSAIDHRAHHNTTSVYTAATIFPLLPNALSNNLSSLIFEQSRAAFVLEMRIDKNGVMKNRNIYPANVMNKAKLTYKRIGSWLDNNTAVPEEVAQVPGLTENLEIQNHCAQLLRTQRHHHGALELETGESHPVLINNKIEKLAIEKSNKAQQLIEDFMIAANVTTSLYLKQKGLPYFRRVVRTPKNWNRIVEIAKEHGTTLPELPDSIALATFITLQKNKNPEQFSDLSLVIIKLLGRGEYVVDVPGSETPGHFGLAVQNYTHSTAPNRRFPDLVTQRVLKAAIKGETSPYRLHELIELSQHCTQMEDGANKVERRVRKSASALFMSHQIGNIFEAICTGANNKATWVRIFNPPFEGKLTLGFEGVHVGQRLRVKLIDTNVKEGFIDFAAIVPGKDD